jgi:hypothetical protein
MALFLIPCFAMSRKLSNNFDAVQLLSMRKLSMAAEFHHCDHGGPYIVMQTGYDPEDPTMTPEEFLLGRTGAWLATKWFIRMPIAERRQQYVFSTAAEVVELMENLPHQVRLSRPGQQADEGAPPEDDPLNDLVRGGG